MGDLGQGREAGFLAMLDPDDAAALRARGGTRHFRAGQALMHEGQLGEEVMILLSGTVKVTWTTREGRDVVLGFRSRGDLVGELAVVDEHPRSSSVIALEPVEALALAGSDFRALVESRPGLGLALVRVVARRFRDADRRRIEFAASRTLGRVAARLVELAERFGERGERGISIELRISQEELASWTGSSREAVAKSLQTLRGLGLVETERRRLTVLDLDELRRQAA